MRGAADQKRPPLVAKLSFSQLAASQPTASQALTSAMSGCSLGSQRGLPPVPRFGDAPVAAPPPLPAAMDDDDGLDDDPPPDVPLSQVDLPQATPADAGVGYMLGTQDFVTPAQADPALAGDAAIAAALAPATVAGAVHARSPAAPPSPARGKRARGGRRGAGSALGATPPGGGGGAPAATPAMPLSRAAVAAAAGALRRAAASPPPARNVFLSSSSAAGAPGTSAPPAPLGPLPLVSRYRAEFREVATLGTGAFSTVSAVVARFDGAPYAVKRSTAEVFAPADRARWQQEAQAMAAAGAHPGIVRYYGAWAEPGPSGGAHFYIQLERCGVSLATLAAVHGGPLPEPALLSVARQAASALAHLHARGIAHGDVKPDNLLTALEAGGGGDGAGSGSSPSPSSFSTDLAAWAGGVRLADYGMASPLASGGSGGWVAPSEGDARYLAPELLSAGSAGAPPAALDKADAFALGASLYELAAGRPLPSSGPVWSGLRAGKLGLLPAASGGFQRLIKALMAPAPADRPALAAVLRWPVLHGGGGEKQAPPAAAAAAQPPPPPPPPPSSTGFAPLALRPTV